MNAQNVSTSYLNFIVAKTMCTERRSHGKLISICVNWGDDIVGDGDESMWVWLYREKIIQRPMEKTIEPQKENFIRRTGS